jgi:hypothetical protein
VASAALATGCNFIDGFKAGNDRVEPRTTGVRISSGAPFAYKITSISVRDLHSSNDDLERVLAADNPDCLPHFKASYLQTAEGYDHLANDLEFLEHSPAAMNRL